MVVGYETKINRTKINQTKYNQTKINRGRNPTNCSIRSRDGAVGSLRRSIFVPPLLSGFFRRLTVVDFFRRLPHFIGLFSLHPLTQRKKLNGSELSILTQII